MRNQLAVNYFKTNRKMLSFHQLDRHALPSCEMVSSFGAIFSSPVALKEDVSYKIFQSGSRGRFPDVHSPSNYFLHSDGGDQLAFFNRT